MAIKRIHLGGKKSNVAVNDTFSGKRKGQIKSERIEQGRERNAKDVKQGKWEKKERKKCTTTPW